MPLVIFPHEIVDFFLNKVCQYHIFFKIIQKYTFFL